MNPKILERGCSEYNALELMARMMTFASAECEYVVEDAYFDYGQDWMYTGIFAYRADGTSYHALTPVEWKQIVSAANMDDMIAVFNDWRFRQDNSDDSVRG